MDFNRRRIAGVDDDDDDMGTPTLELREETGAHEPASTSTIAPYHSALNGVNQPLNMLLKDATWSMMGVILAVILVIRLLQLLWMHLRHVSAMHLSGPHQTYWRVTQWSWVPWLKANILWAPLWNKRHNRELRLSTAFNMGTLPSRLHALILGLLVGSSLVYMFLLDWGKQNRYAVAAEARGRSGTLALVHMIPLVILAGRNNPLIGWLKISYDTFNLFHRWFGRLVVFEAIVHTVSWWYVQQADGGFGSVRAKLTSNMFCGSGMAAAIAMTLLLVTSLSPLRHAFYETFLNVHVVLAFLIFVFTYIHCISAEIGWLPQTTWMIAIFVLWVAERLVRLFTLAHNNWSSRGLSEAVIEPMPGETTRVTLHLPRHVDVRPGTYAYLRFKDVALLESHPFSIAWFQNKPDLATLPVSEKDKDEIVDKRYLTTTVIFLIGAHTGFTRKLYNMACDAGPKGVRLRAGIEGPYGGHHSFDSYGHVVLIAGSTGITHQLSYLKPLIDGYNAGSAATRRVTLIWTMRTSEALEWVRPYFDEILRLPNRRDILRVQLYVTRPNTPDLIVSQSQTVQVLPGRPNLPSILAGEAEEQQGAMVVSVCGPGGLQDDVRNCVREVARSTSNCISFVEESFTW